MDVGIVSKEASLGGGVRTFGGFLTTPELHRALAFFYASPRTELRTSGMCRSARTELSRSRETKMYQEMPNNNHVVDMQRP